MGCAGVIVQFSWDSSNYLARTLHARRFGGFLKTSADDEAAMLTVFLIRRRFHPGHRTLKSTIASSRRAAWPRSCMLCGMRAVIVENQRRSVGASFVHMIRT